MPAFTYLNQHEVELGRTVKDDQDCNDLLQELRRLSGEDWIIRVYPIIKMQTMMEVILRKEPKIVKLYALYADCHGEWQDINCVTADGHGTIFGDRSGSREAIMNYMLGYISCLSSIRAKKIHNEMKDNWEYADEFPETINTR